MKISKLYLDGTKVKSESIDFHDGAISVDNCDLSSVMRCLIDATNRGVQVFVTAELGSTEIMASCFVSQINEANNSFVLAVSDPVKDKINELESKDG